MNIFIIDDDINVCNILKIIIEDKDLGSIIGICTESTEATECVKSLKPDICIIDFLMPKRDGISIVEEIKKEYGSIKFIMLSQVSSKQMISKAYEKGVEFYIQKPVNAIEVEKVLNSVIDKIKMNRTLDKIQNLFSDESLNSEIQKEEDCNQKVKNVLQRLGIMGETGSKDIITLVEYLINEGRNLSDFTMRELCSEFTDNPKSMEQRIRRAAIVGMVNMANLGIEDYMNDIFIEYSNGLYNFEQIKKEMDYIRGKSCARGKINIKKFINGVVYYSEK